MLKYLQFTHKKLFIGSKWRGSSRSNLCIKQLKVTDTIDIIDIIDIIDTIKTIKL